MRIQGHSERSAFFYFIRNEISYKVKPYGASHCGGKVVSRKAKCFFYPQNDIFSGFYAKKTIFIWKYTVKYERYTIYFRKNRKKGMNAYAWNQKEIP